MLSRGQCDLPSALTRHAGLVLEFFLMAVSMKRPDDIKYWSEQMVLVVRWHICGKMKYKLQQWGVGSKYGSDFKRAGTAANMLYSPMLRLHNI